MSSEFERNEASRRSIRIKKKRAPPPPTPKSAPWSVQPNGDVNALIEQLISKQNERNQRTTYDVIDDVTIDPAPLCDLQIEEPDDSSHALHQIQKHIQQLEAAAQETTKARENFEKFEKFKKGAESSAPVQVAGLLTAGASDEQFQYLTHTTSQYKMAELSNFHRGHASRSSTGAVTSAMDGKAKQKMVRVVARTSSDVQKESGRVAMKKLVVAPLGTASTNSYKIQHKARVHGGRGKDGGEQVMGGGQVGGAFEGIFFFFVTSQQTSKVDASHRSWSSKNSWTNLKLEQNGLGTFLRKFS